jgi:hypothetical protein
MKPKPSKMTNFKIITSNSVSQLNEYIKLHLSEGWEVVGSHQLAEKHHQKRYRGTQHVDTIIECEYSISLKWNNPAGYVMVETE